jgi:hypothetical protein
LSAYDHLKELTHNEIVRVALERAERMGTTGDITFTLTLVAALAARLSEYTAVNPCGIWWEG